MAKDKVKAHVRRTKKGVARVTGHARKIVDKKGAKRGETIKKSRKIGLLAAGGLATVGAIAGARYGLKKGKLKGQMMKMASDVNSLARKHGKKATKTMTNTSQTVASKTSTVMNNTAQTVTSKASSLPKLTQAQRGVAMIPVSSKALVPVKMNSTSLVTTGATSKKASKGLLRQAMDGTVAAGRATRRAADEAISLGRQTRSAFDEGYQTHKPSKLSASIGSNLAKLTKAVRSDIQALSQRAKKQRGK